MGRLSASKTGTRPPSRTRAEIHRPPWPPCDTYRQISGTTALVGFYFLKWIPPVPLSLKFAGTYHKVAKVDDEFQLEFEKAAWYHFWKRSDDPFHRSEER